jgi:hypothetical protein
VLTSETAQLPPPKTVNGPNRSPVVSGTEQEVWIEMEFPLMEKVVVALNPPLDETVKVSPSSTLIENPEAETVAVAPKIPVKSPPALEPWLWSETPCPAVYLNVIVEGRLLLP